MFQIRPHLPEEMMSPQSAVILVHRIPILDLTEIRHAQESEVRR